MVNYKRGEPSEWCVHREGLFVRSCENAEHALCVHCFQGIRFKIFAVGSLCFYEVSELLDVYL